MGETEKTGCCAKALAQEGLLLKSEKNETLLDAAGALCGGMYSGGACGALTGGCLMLGICGKGRCRDMVRKLYAWFDETYGMEYGSVNCEDIRPADPAEQKERCAGIVAAVKEKCHEILTEENAE